MIWAPLPSAHTGTPYGVDEARPIDIAAHVESVSARRPQETDRLTADLLDRSWPGGHDDRLDPVAVEWVRRWTPATISAARIECSCAAGRCAVCN